VLEHVGGQGHRLQRVRSHRENGLAAGPGGHHERVPVEAVSPEHAHRLHHFPAVAAQRHLRPGPRFIRTALVRRLPFQRYTQFLARIERARPRIVADQHHILPHRDRHLLARRDRLGSLRCPFRRHRRQHQALAGGHAVDQAVQPVWVGRRVDAKLNPVFLGRRAGWQAQQAVRLARLAGFPAGRR